MHIVRTLILLSAALLAAPALAVDFTMPDQSMAPAMVQGQTYSYTALAAGANLPIGAVVALERAGQTTARRVVAFSGMSIWPADPDWQLRQAAQWQFVGLDGNWIAWMSGAFPLEDPPAVYADLVEADILLSARLSAYAQADTVAADEYYLLADGTGDDSAEWGFIERADILGVVDLD